MAALDRPRLRPAVGADAGRIAALHADSWRRHYRGAYSDAFLDGEVDADRLAVWTQRLHAPDREAATTVAEDDGALAGFVHVLFDDDRAWGALIENLHVIHSHKRRGVGTLLLAEAAGAVVDRGPGGLYLWVLHQNTAAQAFYDARGGQCRDSAFASPPGGDPARLNGAPLKLRYVWPEPSILMRLP